MSPVARTPRRAALAAVVLLASAAPALAHSDVATTSPRDGAVLAASPARVVVTYGEVLGAVTTARVAVGGRDLAARPRLDARDARRLVVPLTGAATGVHRVSWEVVGADGHPLSGEIAFRVQVDAGAAALRRVGARLVGAASALRGALSAP